MEEGVVGHRWLGAEEKVSAFSHLAHGNFVFVRLALSNEGTIVAGG